MENVNWVVHDVASPPRLQFNCVAVLALMCHFKAMCSDPVSEPINACSASQPKVDRVNVGVAAWSAAQPKTYVLLPLVS